LPWCRYECCSRDNLHHRLSPFVDQAALLQFGAVAASQSSSSCPNSAKGFNNGRYSSTIRNLTPTPLSR
jgi:hypothetical protein